MQFVPRSVQDTTLDGVSALCELEKLYREQLNKVLEKAQAISAAVATLEDATEREIIMMYYIDGLILERIAISLHYSYRMIKVIKRRAEYKLLQNA